MKILLINKYHYLKGGAERAYLDMGEILTNAGHEVAYFSMADPQNLPTPWSRFFVSSVDYHQEQSLWDKARAGLRILWNHEANQKLEALIKEFQPDIAHAHNIYHQLSPSIFHVLKRNRVPMVLTLHDYKIVSPSYTLFHQGHIWEHTSGIRAILDRVVDGSLVRSLICASEKWLHQVLGSYGLVDVLISPSQFLADECHKFGFKQSIEVIPNPLLHVPEAQLQKVPGKIVFVGRLSIEKGVDIILRSMQEHALDKHLVIIGDGPEKQTLEVLADELGVTSRVQWKGALYGAKLDQEVLAAEAIVVPSVWYENLPYVVTENQARGVVVIASESGGITERITHDHNGYLFPIGDSQALGRILDTLKIEDINRISKQAVESTRDLNARAFLTQIEELYQIIILKK